MTANETDFELAFWGDCTNTFAEEQKQYVYARLMGIRREHFAFRIFGASVLDIGGGPVSMLLKCHDRGAAAVLDPLAFKYPHWTLARYNQARIGTIPRRGEDVNRSSFSPAFHPFDECWIYNVLQHVDDPALVLRNALGLCSKLRIFEWVNQPVFEGHPHALTKEKLDEWLSVTPGVWGGGTVTPLSYESCFGDAYHAVVPGGLK